MVESESSPIEYAKFILVLVGITALSWLLAGGEMNSWLRWFMGVFMLTFGAFKLIGYKMFVEMFAGYDVIAQRVRVYGQAYPFIELGLGLLYFFNLASPARDIATLAIMAIGTVGVAQELQRRTGIHCACLGNVIKLPLSTVSLVEDVGMGAMAVVMLLLR